MNCRTGRLAFIRLVRKVLVLVKLVSCHRTQTRVLPLPMKNWILLGIQYQSPRLRRLRSVWVTYVAYLWNLSSGFRHEEFHVEFPSVFFGVATRLLELFAFPSNLYRHYFRRCEIMTLSHVARNSASLSPCSLVLTGCTILNRTGDLGPTL